MEQDGGGNIVGQVAHHADWSGQAGEIKIERVAFVHSQPVCRMGDTQALHQIAVDFNHMQMIEALEQWHGQGRQTRADLDHCLAAQRRNGRNDLRNYRAVVKKMLAESLARTVIARSSQLALFESVFHVSAVAQFA